MNRLLAVQQKMARLAAKGRPRVLDLFAGCGGLSLGFQAAGFDIVGAVEIDELAAASHARNFHAGASRHAQARDITAETPSRLARELGLGAVENAVDVIVGGPPCQAFARVGSPEALEQTCLTQRCRCIPPRSGCKESRNTSTPA